MVMVVSDIETGKIVDANEHFFKLSGFTKAECIGRTSIELGFISKETRNEMGKEMKKSGRISGIEYTVYTKSGDPLSVKYYGEVIEYEGELRLLSIGLDTTLQKKQAEERAQLERRLKRAQQMEAWGTMAGRMADGFRRVLREFDDSLTMLENLATRSAELDDIVARLKRSTGNANELVHQVTTFSDQQMKSRKIVSPKDIVSNAVEIVRASIPASIDIQENYMCAESLVSADEAQLHRAVMNIFTNALNAMTDTGGALWVCMDELNEWPESVSAEMDVSQTGIVHISISDTGCGIPSEQIEKIFEPFFTTRKESPLSGMGLAVTYRIVSELGGQISVESTEDAGTTFHLYLPRVTSQMRIQGQHPRLVSETVVNPHILFVDDESMLCGVAEGILTSLGYRVTTYQRSFEALEAFRNHPELFDAVVSDQTMPGMTGLEILEQIKKMRDDIPVILCSGYSQNLSEEAIARAGVHAILEKPFSKHAMGEALREALTDSSTGIAR